MCWEGSCWAMSYICKEPAYICKRRLPRQSPWGTNKGIYFWSQTQLCFFYIIQTFFMNTFLFLLNINFLFMHKNSTAIVWGRQGDQLYVSFYSLFLYFSSKKNICVSMCRFVKVKKKKKGNEIFFYLPKEANPIFLKAKQWCNPLCGKTGFPCFSMENLSPFVPDTYTWPSLFILLEQKFCL